MRAAAAGAAAGITLLLAACGSSTPHARPAAARLSYPDPHCARVLAAVPASGPVTVSRARDGSVAMLGMDTGRTRLAALSKAVGTDLFDLQFSLKGASIDGRTRQGDMIAYITDVTKLRAYCIKERR